MLGLDTGPTLTVCVGRHVLGETELLLLTTVLLRGLVWRHTKDSRVKYK